MKKNHKALLIYVILFFLFWDCQDSQNQKQRAINEFYPGEEILIQENIGQLKKEGYHFFSWNTDENGIGSNYFPGDKIKMPFHDLNLYARWSDSQVYVRFEPNGATYTESGFRIILEKEKNYSLDEIEHNFVREDYKFVGWNTLADGRGTSWNKNKEFSFHEDLTLYAQWSLNQGIRDERFGQAGEVHLPEDLFESDDFKPQDIAMDSKGNIFIAGTSKRPQFSSYQNITIIKIDSSGKIANDFPVSSVKGQIPGILIKEFDDPLTNKANVQKMLIDEEDNLYLLGYEYRRDENAGVGASTRIHIIWKITKEGISDPNFGNNGSVILRRNKENAFFCSMDRDSLGNLYTAGIADFDSSFLKKNNLKQGGTIVLKKFIFNGKPDFNFGTNGESVINDIANDHQKGESLCYGYPVYLNHSMGSIYVGAIYIHRKKLDSSASHLDNTEKLRTFQVLKYNRNGNLDTSFVDNGRCTFEEMEYYLYDFKSMVMAENKYIFLASNNEIDKLDLTIMSVSFVRAYRNKDSLYLGDSLYSGIKNVISDRDGNLYSLLYLKERKGLVMDKTNSFGESYPDFGTKGTFAFPPDMDKMDYFKINMPMLITQQGEIFVAGGYNRGKTDIILWKIK